MLIINLNLLTNRMSRKALILLKSCKIYLIEIHNVRGKIAMFRRKDRIWRFIRLVILNVSKIIIEKNIFFFLNLLKKFI